MSRPPVAPEQIAALPANFQALLRAVMDHYEQRIAALEAEIAAIKKTPRNSSLPPSSEHPHARPAPRRPKSKKKRGGQPGHPRHERALLEVDRVEPADNASERALRPAVIWRKLSFGAQSAQGSRFVEAILTIVETCRRQSESSFEHLAAALQAHFAGQPPPSLLPGA